MGRIIAVANQKGGVGKTTTAVNLSASLAAAEKKTLMIDVDPQGNAGSGIGISKNNSNTNLYQILIGKVSPLEALHGTTIKWLEVIPSNIDLIGAEIELIDIKEREIKLKKITDELKCNYDYIIIDCPPSLGLLTINSLTAADSVLIPLQCEYYALEGLSQLLSTIKLIKKSFNPALTIEGILLTMYDSRTNLSYQVTKEIKEHFPDEVFKTVIPRNVRLSEAPSYGKPVILYDIRSKGAEAYLQLAKEVIINEKKSFR